ncbi:MAG: endolytic transglycosylase MltG [Oscillospiraceae bacterium]|nr:endolytic transglycosylase MltG [Oscillospiraceae bacterium]
MSQENSTPRRSNRRRRRSRRTASITTLYIVAVLGLSVLLAALIWIAANDVLALNKPEHTATVVLSEDYFNIRTKTDEDGNITTTYRAKMGKVASLLKQNDLIEFKSLFRLFSGATDGEKKLRPGAYQLNTEMDYRSLIAGMGAHSDSRVIVEVTIPEGYTVAQTFQLLEDNGVASAEVLNEYAANYNYGFSFLQDIPLGDANRLEGFLFPDTYEFYVNHDPKYVINKLLQNFDAVYTQEMRDQVAAGKYSLREYLTVASLIERETDGSDRGKIASVIYNRLQNPNSSAGTNGFLQVDATLVYITGNVPTAADKEIDSPYNTYKYRGLPPTPIANPGLASLKAALDPENTGYYFYALGDNGKHRFFADYNSMRNWMNSQELYK